MKECSASIAPSAHKLRSTHPEQAEVHIGDQTMNRDLEREGGRRQGGWGQVSERERVLS